MTPPLVSVVVLTCNGMATLPALFDALRRQRDVAHEIVAVDSTSSDGTAEWLSSRADVLVRIPASSFNHGLTRNLGIEHARGDFVVLIVQDAIPANDTWLHALIAPLVRDASVAGSFARQQPHTGASGVTRHYAERAPAASPSPRILAASRDELERLAPLERLARCSFDNVCSCIRRSVWQEHPFRATPIAEDVEWAREVLIAGHRLAYVPDALVTHSHDRSARYELARTYALHHRLFGLLGLRTIPTLPLLVRAIASTLPLHLDCERARGLSARRTARAVALAVAWPLGQYWGALAAARGWRPVRWSGV